MASRGGSFADQLPASSGGGNKTELKTNTDVLDVLDFPCLEDQGTVDFLRRHGRVLFFTRGPVGSSKGSVSSRLQELYPNSCVCWSHEAFSGPDAEPKTKWSIVKAHLTCRQKAAQHMKQDDPVIIIRNSNVRVWEISPYLQLAATYGYTVVILDLSKYLTFDSQVLTATNTYNLDEDYIDIRLKQWEDVHPFAMGWAARPRDAASLLCRYKEIAARLAKDNNHVVLKEVRNTRVYPFCLARTCWFGWDEQNRTYCCSEPVMKAYGSHDEISVVGYAVLGDLVLAVVLLTDAQAALMADNDPTVNAAKNAVEDEGSGSTLILELDEMRCTLDLDAFPKQAVRYEALEKTSVHRGLPPRCVVQDHEAPVSFMILGSTSSELITYSEAARSCASSLRDALASWRSASGAQARMDVDGVAVYGAGCENSRPILVLDEKTVKLDAVFTGYYQSHVTEASGRCVTWSAGTAYVRRPILDAPQHVGAGCDKSMKVAGDVWCPADSTQLLDGIDLPCIQEEKTRHFMRTHGRLLFLVRGRASCRKEAAVAELEKLYTASRAYLSNVPLKWDEASVREHHELCLNTAEDLMKTNSAVITSRSPGLTVCDVTGFVSLACRYGYTVLMIDLPEHLPKYPAFPSAASKVRNKPYVVMVAREWEDVHPFAMGWSPRPKDAALLLRRFRQLRGVLRTENCTLTPRDVSSSQVFPFCLASLCHFGRTRENSDYCNSEKVKEAYGRSDTLRVFGYAVSRGYVFALLELSDEQASLMTRGGDGGGEDVDPQSWKEVPCAVNLATFSPEEHWREHEDSELRAGDRVSLKDVDPSRVTFMPLGSVEGTRYKYSEAAGAPWALLSWKLRRWALFSKRGADCSTSVHGIDVYGDAKRTDGVLLLVDTATAELDVVFTGYYHPHTTAQSRRTALWSRGARSTSPQRWTRRHENREGPHEAAPLSWRSPEGRSQEYSQQRQLFSWRRK